MRWEGDDTMAIALALGVLAAIWFFAQVFL